MLVGNVDIVQHDRITGWAADMDAPLAAIDVVVMVDGDEVGRVSADLFRKDLHDLGPYGDGRHGFTFMFSEPLPADLDHDLAVCFATTGKALGRGQVRLQRAAPQAATGPTATPSRPSEQHVATGIPGYVIHIGLPKTGTKYLQREFFRTRSEMLADGICYPTEFWPELQIFAHHELLKELSHIPNPKLEQVFSTLNESGHRKILLSCEGFIGVPKERLEYLRSLIRGSEVRIVFFARRWSDWIPSQWQQTVKQGAVESLAEMYAKTLASAAGDHAINYNIILDRFSDVFGPDSIQIVPYSSLLDEKEDIYACFARDVLEWRSDIRRNNELVHTSMGPQLTELIRCLNVLETRRQGSSGYHLFQAYNSISNNRTLQSDLQQIFGVMQDYIGRTTIDDACYPLRGILTRINERYGKRIIGGRSGEIFQKRRRVVEFVRTDFLLDDAARSAVDRVYAAVSQRIATLSGKSAA
jgi:hypothetical protein